MIRLVENVIIFWFGTPHRGGIRPGRCTTGSSCSCDLPVGATLVLVATLDGVRVHRFIL